MTSLGIVSRGTGSGHQGSRLLTTGLNSGDTPYGTICGGEGVYFLLESGHRLLDASNTGGPLGHQHPDIVAAIREAATAPVINEGWLWPNRVRAAEDLVELAFNGEPWVGAVRFGLSGSEANDLALSLSQALTGRQALATRERAYHGMTGLARDMTVQPHWHGGLSSLDGGVRPVPRAERVVQLPRPAGERIGPSKPETPEIPAGALDDVAAVIIDYTQGGTYYDPAYQDAVAAEARRAGTLWIADEVVTGLGRMGRWFAFQGAESRPDIVTLGKPLGGGGAPSGAIVVSEELLRELEGQTWQTYSTFRGHPLLVAGVRAYLKVVQRDNLLGRVAQLDGDVENRMRRIAEQHPSVRRIDGRGLHWSIELQGAGSWRDWNADTRESPLATRVVGRALDAGVLFGTSGERDSIFFAPPLIISDDELDTAFQALDHGLELADQALEQTGSANAA
jgi:4-aminobutyrate aminotransferase-like enzyme